MARRRGGGRNDTRDRNSAEHKPETSKVVHGSDPRTQMTPGTVPQTSKLYRVGHGSVDKFLSCSGPM